MVIGADNDITLGFVTRRTKLKLDGNVISDRLAYKVTGAFSRRGGAFGLEDALMAYELNSSWSVRAGQFKAPFLREELVSSSAQLLAERSVVNETFNQDFSQGVEIAFESDRVRAAAMISDGFASRNTPYTLAGEADFALTARAEVLLLEGGDDPISASDPLPSVSELDQLATEGFGVLRFLNPVRGPLSPTSVFNVTGGGGVPAPGGAAWLGLGGILAGRRRRSRRSQ